MKSSSNKLPSLIVLMLGISMSPLALAGGDHSGGGARIESAFRIQAKILMQKLSRSSRAHALCSFKDMKETLSSQVRVVDILIDPKTQNPVPGNLDAWTVPGDIQLLKTSWDSFLSEGYQEELGKRSVQALILHELYRATGKCNDEKFVITEEVFPILKPSTTFTTYKLTFRILYITPDSVTDLRIACDRNPMILVDEDVICGYFASYRFTIAKFHINNLGSLPNFGTARILYQSASFANPERQDEYLRLNKEFTAIQRERSNRPMI